MQSRTARVVVGAFALLLLVFLVAPQIIFGEDASRLRIPGQYIVVLKDSVEDADAAENDIISRTHGERLDSYRSALRGFAVRLSDAEIAVVAEDARVAFVSEDRVISIADASDAILRFVRSRPARETLSTPAEDTEASGVVERLRKSSPSAEAVSAQSQTLPTGINRIDAEGLANSGAGVNVAVIDTGILSTHPDLSGKVVGGKNCTRASGGYTDQNGHGTHVAGTIAATNNTQGVVGVAPGAKLWSVRVLDRNGSGTWSSVICGLDFVTSKAPKNGGPITVANMSLGGGGVSDNNCGNSNGDALHKAICRARDAGVTIVVAAGNGGNDGIGDDAAAFVPAAYDDAVITVSALADSDGEPGGTGVGTSYGADDTFASFSNYGAAVDIGAPGVNIYSTWLSNGYKSISGTSMASPHVAGAAALYVAKNPGALWTQVRDALIAEGEALGAGHTDPSGKHAEPVLNARAL